MTALQFCSDGQTLCSGGEEGVLVVWQQVQSSRSRDFDKSFFPRLGAPVAALSVASSASNSNSNSGANAARTNRNDGTSVLVACANNSFRVVNIARYDAAIDSRYWADLLRIIGR